MEEQVSEGAAPDVLPVLSRKWTVILCVTLAIALVPAFLFIRAVALEASQYHPSVFESYARKAMAEGRYARAVEFCTGALRASVNRDEHHGLVYSLRSKAQLKLGHFKDSLNDLEKATAFWTARYYFAKDDLREELRETGVELGMALLKQDDFPLALRAFSAGAFGSGEPAAVLDHLIASVPAEKVARLWPNGPCVVLQDFLAENSAVLKAQTESQGRTVSEAGIDTQISISGGSSAVLALSEAQQEGTSMYAFPAYMPLTDRALGFRAWVRCEAGPPPEVMLSFWFDQDRKSRNFQYAPVTSLEDKWFKYEFSTNYYADCLEVATEQKYSVADGILYKVGLSIPKGPATRLWFDRIELFLPQ